MLDDALLGKEASYDSDRMHIPMDLSATGTSGYQAADSLRGPADTSLETFRVVA